MATTVRFAAHSGVRTVTLYVIVLVFGGATAANGEIAFQFDPIAEPILSATLQLDFAAMNAHRGVAGHETNFVRLLDCRADDGLLAECELSDGLFGTAAYPDPPYLDLGPLETDVRLGVIDESFFPALAGGEVGLRALFTDTVDAAFALDFIALRIETASETTVCYYGWPVGNENNGFGIELADGDDLPAPLPESIPVGATGTGFDETISSKAIDAVPEPGALALLGVGSAALARSRARRGR